MRDSTPPPARPSLGRGLVSILAFVVFVGGSILAWKTFGGPDVHRPRGSTGSAEAGYYVRFPDQAERGEGQFDAVVRAATNLPDGTLVQISTTDEGTCCPAVKDGTITVTTQDGSCYGLVGAALRPGFDVTITARPDFLPWVVPGPVSNPKPPQQPDSVLAVLGTHFERLSGDQVEDQPDGSKWLVARGSFDWPTPPCGGDPIPLFGGPQCDPADFQQQLQGDTLEEAMTDVMGAISQGRMCEFWSVELPPEVEADHPWPEFSEQWRAWYLDPPKDFSDASSNAGWTEEPFTWHLVKRNGVRHFVDITDHGEVIVSLQVDQLPDHCPNCDPSVVPFWGVVDWALH